VNEQVNAGRVLFLCRTPADLPDGITHVLILHEGSAVASGPRDQVLSQVEVTALFSSDDNPFVKRIPGQREGTALPADVPLIELRNVCADYGDLRVLNNINLRLMPGEHMSLSGPNGSGKSTLLSLIFGDNPRAYGQDIHLFGRKRGSGESVWDIKKRFGIVSNQIHMDYPKRTRAFDVIASGFFDSLGLYNSCGPNENALVREWIALLDLTDSANKRFDALSFGTQRLLLIARAAIKLPPVLILDEPCSGLDSPHRRHVLALIDHIARSTQTTIVYVSHEQDELPRAILRRLEFQYRADGTGYQLIEREA